MLLKTQTSVDVPTGKASMHLRTTMAVLMLYAADVTSWKVGDMLQAGTAVSLEQPHSFGTVCAGAHQHTMTC